MLIYYIKVVNFAVILLARKSQCHFQACFHGLSENSSHPQLLSFMNPYHTVIDVKGNPWSTNGHISM